MRHIILLALAISLTACDSSDSSGGSSSDSSGSGVVYDKTITLEEHYRLALTLEVGEYSAEITSHNNGVTVEWIGGYNCEGAKSEVKVYSGVCNFKIKGQLIIKNPSTFGLGGEERVTIKITKK